MLTLALFVVGVVAVEVAVRSLGIEPDIRDDPDLWALVRTDLNDAPADGIVLLGSSRIQCDVFPEVLMAHSSYSQAVQLGVFSSSVLPALEHVAASGPTGTLLVEVSPHMLFSDDPAVSGHVQARIQAYEAMDASLFGHMEKSARVAFQERFALFTAARELPDVIGALRNGGREVVAAHNAPDRSRRVDRQNLLARPARNEVPPTPPTALSTAEQQIVERFTAAVKLAQASGARVVLLRLPSDGFMRIQEGRYPRELYWQALVDATQAESIHYLDHATLNAYPTVDGSHLDGPDADAFTAALAELL